MHTHKNHVQQSRQRYSYSHAAQLPHRHISIRYLCPPTQPHNDINTDTAEQASYRMPCSREMSSPFPRYISAFPLEGSAPKPKRPVP